MSADSWVVVSVLILLLVFVGCPDLHDALVAWIADMPLPECD